MTLLGAFQTLLYRYTSQSDVVVGSPVANREHPALEPLLGMFVNTIALRTDLAGNPTFRELLQRIGKVALGAIEHQQLPFEKLVEAINPPRDLSYTPIFQIMFVLQNAPATGLSLHGLTLTPIPVDPQTSQCDLAFSVIPEEGSAQLTVEYDTDLFDAPTIDRMVGHFTTLLQAIVANPDNHIDHLPLLSEPERQHVLSLSSEASHPHKEPGLSVPQLIQEQAARSPNATAVISATSSISYAELDLRANGLAQHLLSLGLSQGSRVAIFVDRSVEMAFGLLGILKAACAYVPIDPHYPRERIALLL